MRYGKYPPGLFFLCAQIINAPIIILAIFPTILPCFAPAPIVPKIPKMTDRTPIIKAPV